MHITTPRKHSLHRSQNVERKREHGFIRTSISNKSPQTINGKEKLLGNSLGTVSGKTICLWGFKPGAIGYNNLTLAPKGSHMNKHVQVFFVK
jgi:hypothetical protein